MFPSSSRRRLLILLAALPVLLAIVANLYIQAMAHLEGRHRTFWKALEWAAETLTTTGYGADAEWQHPAMVIFVISFQFLGVFLVYMLVPLILLPLLEQRFEVRLPRRSPKRWSDHVVIFRHGPAVETLIQELCDAKVRVLVVELDEEVARSLLEHGVGASGGPSAESVQVLYERSIPFALKGARLPQAQALVANGTDAENASVVLIARELGFEGRVLALAEEPFHRSPLSLAGAESVITPRLVLGDALASRASLRIHPRVEGIRQLSSKLEIREMRIDPESTLAGKTLREIDLARKTGATVIGQWVTGSLDVETTADTRLVPRGLLLAVGSASSLDQLSVLAGGPDQDRANGPLIVVGYGEVGRRVVSQLREAGEELIVVDRKSEAEEVGVRGDIVDPDVLDSLSLESASGLILALDSDTSTLFATLTIKGRAPDLPVVARVNGAGNIERMYRAGADFALSISQVAADIMVQELLGRDTLALAAQLRLVKISAQAMAESHPSTLEIRKRTGCSVVAVERGDQVIISFGEDFQFQSQDMVYGCGHHQATEKFLQLFGGDPA